MDLVPLEESVRIGPILGCLEAAESIIDPGPGHTDSQFGDALEHASVQIFTWAQVRRGSQ